MVSGVSEKVAMLMSFGVHRESFLSLRSLNNCSELSCQVLAGIRKGRGCVPLT
jgi:hypothetical protein